ncbi:MAG: bifunctional demethylmenaquinone methyltransferase/2-methoxy-6-polyprenyl-1,4-benzoquinol methylase UbiE [Campylobacterales bacterium]|nr:bifunctional demethylmenaquinone methyltransferase/2-methoxy-6-polyprenyl-1,4-benzoquinol methylase UbiE [Campylobacterales bacterium]
MEQKDMSNNVDKQQKIIGMFDDIASTYDIANRVLSFGIDKQWRKKGCDKAYEILAKNKIGQIVDVACGTGDLLLYWKARADKHGINVDKYTGVDPSIGMLEVAKEKVSFASFIEGKAQALPFADKSCDIVSISYGIRNVVDRAKGLSEFYRVLNNGGMVVILEFTKQEKSGFVSKIVDFYMKKILPAIGGLVSQNYAAYRYLPDSIEQFLTTAMLEDELKQAGFDVKYVKSFSMGISTLIVAQKPLA